MKLCIRFSNCWFKRFNLLKTAAATISFFVVVSGGLLKFNKNPTLNEPARVKSDSVDAKEDSF